MFNYITDERQCQRVAGIFTICTLKSKKERSDFLFLRLRAHSKILHLNEDSLES